MTEAICSNQLCYIKHINVENSEVIFFCRGTNILITLSFEKIINDKEVISNFSPKESSVIGYYFGRYYVTNLNNKVYSITSFDFIDSNLENDCIITMIDRNKNIIFSNGKNNVASTLSPTNIFENKQLLNKFGSLQACYIGILSGIDSTKSNRSGNKKSTQCNLSLVKRT